MWTVLKLIIPGWHFRSSNGARVVVGLLVLGCMAPLQPVDYLNQASGKARQDDVLEKFGPPFMQVPGEGGRTIWIYRYAGVSAASPSLIEELWCYEHALTFGPDKVLQRWTRQECHKEP